MTRHEYKGFKIIKLSGNSARRGYKKTGYAIFLDFRKVTFETLRDAKTFIDCNVSN